MKMNSITNTLIIFILLFSLVLKAQVENVIVETYYISDSKDATDTIGGRLDVGSKTYRIYIDLKPGSKLKKIYGDANHTLKIASTSAFFNNISEGKSFSKDINKSRLKENTVALDSWLTLGLASKSHFGVLKTEDADGSILGVNDGGSAVIPGGLLVNNDSIGGIPLTKADGLASSSVFPSNWASYGILDNVSGKDSTIFGEIKGGSLFISNNAGLQNSGVMGTTVENKVLVAQLTTKGEISFELNLEIEEPDGVFSKIVKYVAKDDVLTEGEILSPYLKYPSVCGCTDLKYLEYKNIYSCSNVDSCKTIKVFGCTDPLACNYDPGANVNLPDFCCYPGSCQDRDISLVCSELGINEMKESFGFYLFPNPAHDRLEIQIFPGISDDEIKYEVFDIFGKMLMIKNLTSFPHNNFTKQVDIADLNSGLYLFRLSVAGNSSTKIFIKN